MGNVAINKTATSNMSVAPFTPDKAVNGIQSPFNRWVGTVPGWLQVDLGVPYWISSWSVYHMAAIPNLVGWENYVMMDYGLQGSNDARNWLDIVRVTSNKNKVTQIAINSVRYRYFRTYVENGLVKNSRVASIVEMELGEFNNPPYLSGLTLSSGTLSPVFNKQVFNYKATVGQEISTIYVVPSTTATGASITVNGENVANSAHSQDIVLNDETTIRIVVSVGQGISETYTLTIYKEASPYLDDIYVSDSILSEEFNPYNTSYIAYLDDGITDVTVIPTAQSPNALINVNGQSISNGDMSAKIDVSQNNTMISVYVENASPQIVYHIETQRNS